MPAAPIESVAFSPDGTSPASGSNDRTTCIWDVHTGQLLHLLSGHSSAVSSVAFSPDGVTLASGSWDRTIRLWDAESRQTTRILEGQTLPVLSVAFSPDSTLLISGSDDETTKVWDVGRGICLETYHIAGPYAEMNIAGVLGLTEAQQAALKALGAIVDNWEAERLGSRQGLLILEKKDARGYRGRP